VRATIGSDNFNKNFLISLWMHVILITLALIGGDILAKYFGSSDVEIVRSAIRVDVVGMPKFTVQELKELEKIAAELPKEPEAVKAEKAPAKPEAEDIIKKDDLVIQEVDKKKKKSSFLSVLNEYSTKKVKGKEEKKGKKEGSSDKNLEALVLEGNRLSQGSALTGDYADGPGSEFAGYVQTLPGVIRPQWKLPQYLMDKNLRCRIKIFLSNTGKLLKLEVVESSGEPEFDGRAENAIRTTEFPKPSEAAAKRLTSSGIILGFPL
jgi:TonB family protein